MIKLTHRNAPIDSICLVSGPVPDAGLGAFSRKKRGMIQTAITHREESAGQEIVDKRPDLLEQHIDYLVDSAPIMMHVVDLDFNIVKVNERWLEALGYDEDDVIGHRSTDFLTEESRARVIGAVIPLFLRTGSTRSCGVDFLRKDGRVLSRLLDAEARGATADTTSLLYAAIFHPYEPSQWIQAAATLGALRELIRVRSEVESARPSPGSAEVDIDIRDKVLQLKSALGLLAEKDGIRKFPPLTKREMEVLRLLASGARNSDIAECLSLAVNTVKFHNESIYQKLGVRTRTQAARVAAERGLLGF